jgi:predicted lipoprotein with Yx(FWY)xxD motif
MDIRRSLTQRRGVVGAASLTAIAIAAAGCGGSSGGDAVTPQASGSTATIGATDGHLVDGLGRTLYLFEADTGSTSTCAAACATEWPPVTTDADPLAAGAVKPGLLGTTERSDGATQVTYGGHPLYRYGGDSAPGDMNGAGSEAFGAEWYPLTTSGEALEDEENEPDDSPTPNDGQYTYDY